MLDKADMNVYLYCNIKSDKVTTLQYDIHKIYSSRDRAEG